MTNIYITKFVTVQQQNEDATLVQYKQIARIYNTKYIIVCLEKKLKFIYDTLRISIQNLCGWRKTYIKNQDCRTI